MELTFASYNIHKAVGLDRRRDPERILAVLHEIGADVVALQEADRRFGERASVLPRAAIDDYTPYRIAPLAMTSEAIGWHGNALLVRKDIAIHATQVIPLPVLEPRGAICADLAAGGKPLRVVGMHLDLSGLRRRHQLRAVLNHMRERHPGLPAVLMGDLNEWSAHGGALREFGRELAPTWQLLAPGRSFPARRPLAMLDRIVASPEWRVIETSVHHSALAARASDHLPVLAKLKLG